MRINLRYSAVVGILAAAFSMLGSASAQAGPILGTSASTCAGACALQAPASHLPGNAGGSIVLTAALKSSAWRQGIGITRRLDNGASYGRERLGLPGQQDRIVLRSHRCHWGGWDRCGYGDYGRYRYGGWDRDRYGHGDWDHYGHGDWDRYRYGHGDYDRYRYGDYDHYGHGDYDRYRYNDYDHYGHGDWDHYR